MKQKLPRPENESERSQESTFSVLAHRIYAGDRDAEEQLCQSFSRSLRCIYLRRVGPDAYQDYVQETFIRLLPALREGRLKDPSRLAGFVMGIVRNLHMEYIHEATRQRAMEDLDESIPACSQSPEHDAIEQENVRIMEVTLRELKPREREVLERFYVHRQGPEEICAVMQLSLTQFRLLKSRTKAKYARRVQHKMRKPVHRAQMQSISEIRLSG